MKRDGLVGGVGGEMRKLTADISGKMKDGWRVSIYDRASDGEGEYRT